MVVVINEKQATLDLCLRNTMRYAMSKIPWSPDLNIQINYAMENCKPATKEFLTEVLQIMGKKYA